MRAGGAARMASGLAGPRRNPGLITRLRKTISKQTVPWLFLLPAVLLFAVFAWYPIILGLIVSLQKFQAVGAATFVGFDNFKTLFADPLFAVAWKNTGYFVVLGIVIGFLVPVTLAIVINEMRHHQAFFRVSYYLPSILPGIVVATLWRWLYDPGNGLFNTVLQSLGLAPAGWLLDQRMAMPALVFMATWAGAGATTMIYLAALQSVPAELYEAAEIDGASIWRRALHITIAQIRPVMLAILILQVIGTFQVFTEPFVMTGGGPNNATMTVMLLIYRYAFRYYDFGVASALGFTLFIVLLVVTAIYMRVTRKYSVI